MITITLLTSSLHQYPWQFSYSFRYQSKDHVQILYSATPQCQTSALSWTVHLVMEIPKFVLIHSQTIVKKLWTYPYYTLYTLTVILPMYPSEKRAAAAARKRFILDPFSDQLIFVQVFRVSLCYHIQYAPKLGCFYCSYSYWMFWTTVTKHEICNGWPITSPFMYMYFSTKLINHLIDRWLLPKLPQYQSSTTCSFCVALR